MKKETREKLYKISEVAEILGVHEDTLRNWEREGFVVPERIGKRSDRRYTAEMIGKIKEQGLVSDLAKKGQRAKKDLADYTKDELIKELQLLKKQKKYGLVWENHVEEVVERCKKEAPILVTKKDKQIKDKDKNKPTNILIEGDNYHALQVLNYTHKDKIDVIYIDPPYNTGNKDFVYNDAYVDKEDNFRHSKWLSFMESRLRLARNLLKKDGVIFISIGEDEIAQLKLLCNGIFGEENFITNISRLMKSGGNKGRYFSPNIDYILVYAREIKELKDFRLPLEDEYIKKIYSRIEKLGNRKGERYREMGLYQAGLDSRPNQRYWIECPDGSLVIPPGETMPKKNINGEKIKPNKNDGVWRWIFTRYQSEFKKGNIVFKKTKTSSLIDVDGKQSKWNIYTKIWLNDRSDDGRVPTNLLTEFENRNSSKEINEVGIDFQFAKPKEQVKWLIKITNFKKELIALDFMAGSGTTGHAVLDLNKEDSGNRKFILCTNNELNGLEKELREKGFNEEEIEEHGICRRITHKRIEKVIKGYTKPNGEKVKGLGGSLEYFKTEFVDVENIDKVTDKKKLEFTYEAGQMIALKEDAFKEVAKNKFYQIFTDEKDKFVGIYFRENLDKLSEMEKKILDKKDVKLYLFSYGVNDFKKDYSEYKNVAVKDIPEPILKIYKSLNN